MMWDRGLTANVWELHDGQERIGKVIRLGAKFRVEFGGELVAVKDDIESAKKVLENCWRDKHRLKGL